MAAEGNTELVGKDDATYGWSPAYEAVAALRERLGAAEKLAKRMAQRGCTCDVIGTYRCVRCEARAFLAEHGAEAGEGASDERRAMEREAEEGGRFKRRAQRE